MSALRKIGAYELTHHIGRGGMGDVFRARHTLLDRPAALKLIRPNPAAGTDAATLLRRFEREARATSALTSPHTVQVFDYGATDDSSFYYAMELLDGVDLSSAVDRYGPFPPSRTIHVLRQICQSLAEAHHVGLVHRDIKPANIFVCRAGLQLDFVKVLDFGLVKFVASTDPELSQLTRGDVSPGSPAFMPPEAADGSAAIAPLSDVYGLGCVAYWLLSGKLVFERDTPLRTVVAHIKDPPPPLSERCDQPVPPELEAIVMACLAKDPQDRPESCLALASALAECSVPAWTDAEAADWWEEHDPAPCWTDRAEVITWPEGVEPAAAAGPAHSPSELALIRARVQAALRHNFVYSRLGFTEMDRRVEVARLADSVAQLRPLVADLPESEPVFALEEPDATTTDPAPPPAVAPPRAAEAAHAPRPRPDSSRSLIPAASRSSTLVSVFSGTNRRGSWRPSPRMNVVSVFGGSVLDFRYAQLEPGVTKVECVTVMGGTRIIVPPDLYVQVDGFSLFGHFGRSGRGGPPPEGEGSWLRVSGFAFFGGVTIEVRDPRDPVDGVEVPPKQLPPHRRDSRR